MGIQRHYKVLRKAMPEGISGCVSRVRDYILASSDSTIELLTAFLPISIRIEPDLMRKAMTVQRGRKTSLVAFPSCEASLDKMQGISKAHDKYGLARI